ncbi:MAG: hypothetical protein ABIR16_04430 [Dokdonella sp.]
MIDTLFASGFDGTPSSPNGCANHPLSDVEHASDAPRPTEADALVSQRSRDIQAARLSHFSRNHERNPTSDFETATHEDGGSFRRVAVTPWMIAIPTMHSTMTPIHCIGTFNRCAPNARPVMKMRYPTIYIPNDMQHLPASKKKTVHSHAPRGLDTAGAANAV